MRPYKLAIVIPDMQIPFEDMATMGAVEKYLADECWDYYVNLGDFMDFHCISKFSEETPGETEGETIKGDYDYGEAVIGKHAKLVRERNHGCDMTLLEGNHSYRVTRFMLANPKTKGMLDVPTGLKLKEKRIRWVPFWSEGKLHQIGKLYFAHGKYTNLYHAAKHANMYGVSMLYGHTHDVQVYSKPLLGKDKTIMAASCGCLCEYEQKYMRGSPSAWQQAIAVVRCFPDGFFQAEIVRIFKHRFVAPTNGKVYHP